MTIIPPDSVLARLTMAQADGEPVTIDPVVVDVLLTLERDVRALRDEVAKMRREPETVPIGYTSTIRMSWVAPSLLHWGSGV